MRIKAFGTLEYGESRDGEPKAVLQMDDNIGKYYRSLIPKYIYARAPMYPTHVTVVRNGREKPVNMEYWGKYEGEQVEYEYSPLIGLDYPYYFLRAWSSRIEEIRLELGLPKCRPEFNDFHITIANVKTG
jgi:hypothetical protein